MPIWPRMQSLMNKRLYEALCQKFGPVRKLLWLLVGPPVLVGSAGAICERFADIGGFIPPHRPMLTRPRDATEDEEREFQGVNWSFAGGYNA